MYQVVLERHAERDLDSLPKGTVEKVVAVVRGLADNPRPPGCRKLVGSRSDWRIRIGDYRIVYEIDDRRRQVRVLLVRHRREAYR